MNVKKCVINLKNETLISRRHLNVFTVAVSLSVTATTSSSLEVNAGSKSFDFAARAPMQEITIPIPVFATPSLRGFTEGKSSISLTGDALIRYLKRKTQNI